MRKHNVTLAIIAAGVLALPGVANAQANKLVVGMPTTPPNVIHMPVLIAKDLGLYKKHGVEVETLALDGGVKVFRAMVAGSVDVAMAPGAVMLVGRSKGVAVKGVLGILPKTAASMVARDNVKDMADLKGKRIGIQQPGGFADLLSKSVLRAAKIDPKEVNFVSIATEDVPALVANQVDTAILHIEQEILAKSKVPSLHAIARMWETQPKQMYQLMAVSEKLIKDKPKAVQGFVTANIEAVRVLYTDKAKVLPILIKHTGYPKEIIEQTYDFMIKNCMWDANTGLSPERINFTSDLMTRVGNIDKGKTPTYEEAIDTSFAKAAIAQIGEWKGPVCPSAVF